MQLTGKQQVTVSLSHTDTFGSHSQDTLECLQLSQQKFRETESERFTPDPCERSIARIVTTELINR